MARKLITLNRPVINDNSSLKSVLKQLDLPASTDVEPIESKQDRVVNSVVNSIDYSVAEPAGELTNKEVIDSSSTSIGKVKESLHLQLPSTDSLLGVGSPQSIKLVNPSAISNSSKELNHVDCNQLSSSESCNYREMQEDSNANSVVNPVENSIYNEAGFPKVNSIQNEFLNTEITIPTRNTGKPRKLLSKSLKTKRSISEANESIPNKPLSESVKGLSDSHTLIEQSIYEVMYKETIALKKSEGYFSWTFLAQQIEYKNEKTIRLAIIGLIDKRSIEVVGHKTAGRTGTRYHIFSPREILLRRRQANIVIDPRSKKIL